MVCYQSSFNIFCLSKKNIDYVSGDSILAESFINESLS